MPESKGNSAVRWVGGIFAGPVLLVAYATWTGRALILGTVLLGLAGLRSQSNPVILSSCILAAALVAAGAASYAAILGLRYECGFAREEVFCGENVVLTVTLRNHNIFPGGFLWITASAGRGLRPQSTSRSVPYIGPGGKVTLRFNLNAVERGRVSRLRLRARSLFPTGLFQTGFSEEVPVELLVLPRTGALGNRFASYLAEGRESRVYSPAFLSGETRSLREYRPGDNLRRVHWRVSAHRGKLVVREFEEPVGTEVFLLLDPYRPALRRGDFEWLVSLAATVALSALERDMRVRIALGGPRIEIVRSEDPFGVREALRRLALFRGRTRSYAQDLLQFGEMEPSEGIVLLLGIAPETTPGERVSLITPDKDADLLLFDDIRTGKGSKEDDVA